MQRIPTVSAEAHEVRIPLDPDTGDLLEGTLVLPANPIGLVLFAHGSGSSRHSPRNRGVAERLHAQGLGTLLFDLMTMAEEQADRAVGAFRFDVELLGERLVLVTDWLNRSGTVVAIPVGYFGASTGAAAALVAAAQRPHTIAAVVSRGGRPDLAAGAVASVRAPTLLIVGELDRAVIEMNRFAARQLQCPYEIALVPGATHLFEEPGALDRVSELAGAWFLRHLVHT